MLNPSSRALIMTPTTQMVALLVLLLTPGVAAADDGVRRRHPAGPGAYVGRSGADLLLNSSQPAGAVLLNGRDIVSGSFPPVRGAPLVRARWRLANTKSTLNSLRTDTDEFPLNIARGIESLTCILCRVDALACEPVQK